MKNNALRLTDKDNVVIAMFPIKKGEAVIVGGKQILDAAEDVDAGHKIAVSPIGSGSKVFRYGEPIVEATRAIQKGEWVHVHNTRPIPGDLKE